MASNSRSHARFGRLFSPRRRSATPADGQSRRERRVKRFGERFRRFSLSTWQRARIVESVCALFRSGAEAARLVRGATGAQLVGAGYGRSLRLESLESRQLLTTTPWSLESQGDFAQDWSDTSLIVAENSWTGVPSIVGYRGDAAGETTGIDPQTVVEPRSDNFSVAPNLTSPSGTAFGGVAEFEEHQVVGLKGSSFFDTPNLVLHMDSSGRENVTVSYKLRDIDTSPVDAIQAVALQYRIGDSGDFTNVPEGFVDDASNGVGAATEETQVSVSLPEWSNIADLQIRIITADAVGNDEWIGVDDISVTSTAPNIPDPEPDNASPEIDDQTFSVAEDNDGSAAFATVVATDAEGAVTFAITGGSGS